MRSDHTDPSECSHDELGPVYHWVDFDLYGRHCRQCRGDLSCDEQGRLLEEDAWR